jgi:type I restriction enzyme S subunit
VTVKLWGQGIVRRSIVAGQEIGSATRLAIHANQFLISRIDARNGASGLVPESLDGAVVSNDFPAFNVDTAKVCRRFLGWYAKTQDFVEKCRAASEGTTNRVRLNEDRFFKLTIPLPPLEEQRRIIKHLHYLFEKHSEVVQLRRESEAKLDDLCRSILFSSHDVTLLEMADLVSLRKPDTEVERHNAYSFAGVYCFGRGVFKGQTKNGTDFAYDRLTKISASEFIYPKLMAWEGALGVVPVECDGLFVSPEYPVFTINTERVLPEVIDVYYRTPSVWPHLAEASTGTNVRRRRLHPSGFLKLRMPVPSMAIQHRIRNARLAFESISRIRRDSESALKAMLPAVLNRAFGGGM